MIKINFFILIGLLYSVMTVAQAADEVVVNKKPRRLKLQFEENLVKGSAESPETSFLNTKDEYNYKKMIKIRENFIPEVESDSTIFKGK